MKHGRYPSFLDEPETILNFFTRLSQSDKGCDTLIDILFQCCKYQSCGSSIICSRIKLYTLDKVLVKRNRLVEQLQSKKSYYSTLTGYIQQYQYAQDYLYMQELNLSPYKASYSSSLPATYSESSLRRIKCNKVNTFPTLPMPSPQLPKAYNVFSGLKESPTDLAYFAHYFCAKCLVGKGEFILDQLIEDLTTSMSTCKKSKTATENPERKFFFYQPSIAFLEKQLEYVELDITEIKKENNGIAF